MTAPFCDRHQTSHGPSGCAFCGIEKRIAEADAAAASHDPVNHPAHYTRGGIECIDVIEKLGLGFHLGNALKYLWRAGVKGDELEDLRKARWYLDREIARLERIRSNTVQGTFAVGLVHAEDEGPR